MSFIFLVLSTPPPPGKNISKLIGPPPEVAPIIAKNHFRNDLVAGVMSTFINIILIYMVSFKISNASKLFKKVIYFSKTSEILFSISYIFTIPVFTSITIDDAFSGLMIVYTGFGHNIVLGRLFLSVAIILLTQQIFLAPLMSYVRYVQVCRKKPIKCLDFLIIIFVNVSFQILTSICLCFASFPTADDVDLLLETALRFRGSNSPFLLLSYKKHTTNFDERLNQILAAVSALSYMFCLIISILVMVFCTIQINMTVRTSRQQSNNLVVIQKRVNQVLFSQFLCPLILIQVPFYYSVLGSIIGISQGLVTDLLPLLFAWSPVVDGICFCFLNSEIRNAIFRRKLAKTSSNNRQTF